MSLKSILDEMEKNRPNAEMEVSLGNPNTYGGRVGLKRAAEETLKRLRLSYRNELMTSTVFIVTTGSAQEAFTDLACSESFNCFSAEPKAFYKELASKIAPSLYGREGARQLFNIASNVLYDKMQELDIASYPNLQFSEKYNRSVANAEEFAEVLKSAVNDQVGPEVVGINAVHSLVDRAIKANHSAPVTPVVLNTSDESFALNLYENLKRRKLPDGTFAGITDKVFLVVAGAGPKELKSVLGAFSVKKVSEESVGDVLSAIRNKVV